MFAESHDLGGQRPEGCSKVAVPNVAVRCHIANPPISVGVRPLTVHMPLTAASETFP